jgi:glycerophosphoryl diester phosphodiesterase
MKKKIIGHRGAAGLELENTATSLERAVNLSIYAVELDVRLTNDKKLVLCHDGDLIDMAEDTRKISNFTLAELQKIELKDGSQLLTLHEALKITQDNLTIVEIKDNGSARLVLDELKKFPNSKFIVASSKLEELALMRNLAPDLPLYVVEHTKPIESIHFARQLKLNGIALNFWLLNPLTYWYALRSGLSIYVYTLNSKFLTKLVWKLYPEIAVCTDHPEWFVRKRRKSSKLKEVIDARSIRPRRKRS